MKNLETGTDKIKKICDILKAETLDPAKEEAQRIIEQAHQDAHEIIRNAEKKSEEIIQNGKKSIEKERAVFQTSINQACKQGMEALRQDIQNNLFNKELGNWVNQTTKQPNVMAHIVEVLLKAVEKEGLGANFSLVLPAEVNQEDVVRALVQDVQKKLKEKPIEVGSFIGGVQLKLEDRQMTLDMTDQSVKELLEMYISKAFRKYLFENN